MQTIALNILAVVFAVGRVVGFWVWGQYMTKLDEEEKTPLMAIDALAAMRLSFEYSFDHQTTRLKMGNGNMAP